MACINSQAQQRLFTFTVNTKNYQVNETKLNEFFGEVFIDLTQRGITKLKYFELWQDSFERWKNTCLFGHFTFTTYSSLMGSVSYSGQISREDLGLNDDGSTPKGNPNNKNNNRLRTSYLTGYMEFYIINNVTEFRVTTH